MCVMSIHVVGRFETLGHAKKQYSGLDKRKFKELLHGHCITIRCLCNVYPLIPHFYIAKTGVCRGLPIFLIFAPKHRLLVLVRTASARRF